MAMPTDLNSLLAMLQASTQVEIMARLMMAAVLGGCIGFERER